MRSRIGLLVPLLLFACALTPVRRPWKLELKTSGGFTGRGAGSVTIESNGNVHVRSLVNGECNLNASDAELKRLETLLAAARPDRWRPSYAPENRCCDRLNYDFTLTFGEKKDEKKYVTEWISAPLPMPKDLAELSDAVLQILHDRACTPTR
jgi:hypothetical protein